MKGQVVSWWRLLWFDLTIPRHSFTRWLAMKNKLPTKERMIQWGKLAQPYSVEECRIEFYGHLHLILAVQIRGRKSE